MGLITKEVEIHIYKNCKLKQYYWDLGYDFKIGDTISVKVDDLLPSSGAKVKCTCDYCGKELEKSYSDYQKAMSCEVKKIACHNCHSKKNKEIFLIKYGVTSPTLLPEVKEKTKKTVRERYGTDYPLQAKEVQEKAAKTMMNKYGVMYSAQSKEIRQKQEQTCLERYGSKTPFSHESSIYDKCKEKAIETSLKRYGTENPMQNKTIKEKVEKTCIEKYGYKNPFSSDEIKNKVKSTMVNKYGVENPMQSQEIKEKAYNTNLEHYGVKHVLQNDEIIDKMKANNLDKYGVEYISQLPEVRQKVINTLYSNQTMCTSRQQKYIAELYNMELNYPILYWSIDIYDKENDICWNYDGGGHYLSVELGSESLEEFNRKELIREKTLRKDGHKLATIISKDDFLPSDTILLQMLSNAKQYFSDYPEHSWIEFNIDNGIVRNAENKDGVPYFYGELRKIKKTDVSLSA